jgi:hypothetical protein
MCGARDASRTRASPRRRRLLEPGSYTLIIAITGYRPAEAIVAISPKTTAPCELWLEPE